MWPCGISGLVEGFVLLYKLHADSMSVFKNLGWSLKSLVERFHSIYTVMHGLRRYHLSFLVSSHFLWHLRLELLLVFNNTKTDLGQFSHGCT